MDFFDILTQAGLLNSNGFLTYKYVPFEPYLKFFSTFWKTIVAPR